MTGSMQTRWTADVRESPSDLTITRDIVVIGAGGHGMEMADIVRAKATTDAVSYTHLTLPTILLV